MNALSAVGIATACGALAAAACEWEVEPVFACGAALVLAFTGLVWQHATHAEVHAVALGAIACGSWAALRWARTGSVRVLVASAVASALALAIHSAMILVVPGIALAALARRPTRAQAVALLALGAAIVAACYAYLPLRSAAITAAGLDPARTLGISGAPFWDYNHPVTLAGFRREIGGGEFDARGAVQSLFAAETIEAVPRRFGRVALGSLALGILVIAAAGMWWGARHRTLATLGLCFGGALPVLFVLAYHAESDPQRYYLPAFWVIAFFLAIGAQTLARGGLEMPPRSVVALVGLLFAFVIGSNIVANLSNFDAPQNPSGAVRWIDRVIANTPENSVIVAPWVYATPLAYAAYVQHRMGHRIVLAGWPGDYAAHYLAWLRSRPVTLVDDGYDPGIEKFRLHWIDPPGGVPRLYAVEGRAP
jgi:hypothetical protein